MRVREFFFVLLAMTTGFGWSIDDSEEDLLTVKEIVITGTEMSLAYIHRHLAFKNGDQLSEVEIEVAMNRSRISAQYDANIYILEIEYTVKDKQVFFAVFVHDASVQLSFGGFSTGTIVKYRNLLGEGIDLGTHLGFSRQMLFLDWKRFGSSPIGFSMLVGHRIFNPFESIYRTFSVGSTNRLYLWLGPHIKVGLLNAVYRNVGGWNEAIGTTSLGLGGFISMDHYYLLDSINCGFKFDAEYLCFLSDLTEAHRIYLRSKAILSPFNTNRVRVHLDTRLHWANDSLVDRGSNGLSRNTGQTAWDAGIYLPVNFIRIVGETDFYIGLEPGILIGKAGSDQLDFHEPNVAVSLAPVFQVGFPASAFFSLRFKYNISEQRLTFSLGFSNLPYTKELAQL